MLEKRKDDKGRILKTGENQRPNGTYEYRYTDAYGKSRSVYAKTLKSLRQKETDIQRERIDGMLVPNKMTVAQLVDAYMELKRGISPNTLRAYRTVINRIRESEFGSRLIRDIKISDAKRFYISLHDLGCKRNTIVLYHNLLRPAFEMALDDDFIRKNPFKFKMADILKDDSEKRIPLTKEQQKIYLQFVQEVGGDKYYDDIVVLLGTGLRVSELYGLTKKDIDLKRRLIFVERQLCRTAEKPYFIEEAPKTDSGVRCIPMSDSVYMSLKRILKNRNQPKVEFLIDGYSGFVFLDKA